ncbi:MAG: protein TolR [Rhodospirillaceae bacterium]|nr:protein TolR [Rhodospirillaceae bacterium]
MMSRSGNGRGRRSRRGAYIPMSEINVTPMVDVMLVLLVVFMVSAPLMTVGVPVDLPKTDATQMVGQDEPLVVSVNAKGIVFLQDTEVTLEQLAPRLLAITQNKKDTRIFVRGDKAIAYGQVMEVMGTVNLAGFTRVALLTQLPSGPRAGGTK